MGLIPDDFYRVAQVGHGQDREREVEEQEREDTVEGEDQKKESSVLDRDKCLVNIIGKL